ncbi:MAG TPA: tRNA pseudouridine synthase A, partial [Chitinophagaceae bacterium]|nr:tRNA pseudouridine synthase A [Chitinophagaceae bacterium]
MTRYFFELSYNGKGYAGFQRQKNARAIQDEIDQALSQILHEPVRTTGSSRTDAGVHARQNFVHFDGPDELPQNVLYSLNAILSRQIAAVSLFPVPPKAHARYDACSRSYRYCIYTLKDPFLQDFGYFYPYPLNLEILQKAAEMVLENIDFQA